MQSINQELTAANQELAQRNEQVSFAQERAEAIVETVREPLIVLTEDGHVERANAAFRNDHQEQGWDYTLQRKLSNSKEAASG